MIRRIIEINEEKCNGCGICANASHEGAIEIVNGKAKLLREDYCDGLGDCLPACPMNAISFVEREAPEYNEAAVKAAQAKKASSNSFVCPGMKAKSLHPETNVNNENKQTYVSSSQLMQWPVQIKLVAPNASFFDGAKLLIAADCTAYAYANFHQDFIKNHVTIVGCPKLDNTDYSIKLTEIIKNNDIKEVCIVRMEVPCCGGLENAAKDAIKNSGKFIPWNVVTISTDGRILD